MAQSLSRILVHTVFSTKGREPLIGDHWRSQLHAYLAGALNNMQCTSLRVGGTNDHVHMFHVLARTITVSDLLRELKMQSSKWAKGNSSTFAWQAGYGVFSVSESKAVEVIQYIDHQTAHHEHVTFQEEFRLFLARHGIAFDERYVWD